MALQSIIDDDELVAILYSMSYRVNDRSVLWALTAGYIVRRCHAPCLPLHFTLSSSTVFLFVYISDRVLDHHWEDYVRSSLWFVLIDGECSTAHSLALYYCRSICHSFTHQKHCFLWDCINAHWAHFYGLGKYWQSLKRKLLFQGWATFKTIDKTTDKTLFVSQDFLDHQIKTKLFILLFTTLLTWPTSRFPLIYISMLISIFTLRCL